MRIIMVVNHLEEELVQIQQIADSMYAYAIGFHMAVPEEVLEEEANWHFFQQIEMRGGKVVAREQMEQLPTDLWINTQVDLEMLIPYVVSTKAYTSYTQQAGITTDWEREKIEQPESFSFYQVGNVVFIVIVGISIVVFSILLIRGRKLYKNKFTR